MLFHHRTLGELMVLTDGSRPRFKKSDLMRMLLGTRSDDKDTFLSRDEVYQLIEAAPDSRRKDSFCLWFSSHVERKLIRTLYLASLKRKFFPEQKTRSYFEKVIWRKQSLSLAELKEDYGISEKRLLHTLLEAKILVKLGEGFVPSKAMLEGGFLELDPNPKRSLLVTPSGQIHVYLTLKQVGVLPLMDRQVTRC